MELRAAREVAGLTQKQVAIKSHISERLYQDYEYGRYEPGVRTAIRIADTLGVLDLREIFPFYDSPFTPDNPGDNPN